MKHQTVQRISREPYQDRDNERNNDLAEEGTIRGFSRDKRGSVSSEPNTVSAVLSRSIIGIIKRLPDKRAISDNKRRGIPRINRTRCPYN